MERSERRTNKRVPARFKVNYIHDGDYIISHSKDLSVDGMFIFTKNPPQVGETSILTFAIGDMHDIQVKAMVIWRNEIDSGFDSGMGIQFIDPPKALTDAILSIVNRVAILDSPHLP